MSADQTTKKSSEELAWFNGNGSRQGGETHGTKGEVTGDQKWRERGAREEGVGEIGI